MPDIEKFADEFKKRVIYEKQNESRLSSDLLQQWETNKKTNEKMAKLIICKRLSINWFKGCFAGIGVNLPEQIEIENGNVDGFRIEKAIIAEGMTLQKEKEEKKGFLDKLGLGG
jgi:hypothetical protein